MINFTVRFTKLVLVFDKALWHWLGHITSWDAKYWTDILLDMVDVKYIMRVESGVRCWVNLFHEESTGVIICCLYILRYLLHVTDILNSSW